MAVVGIGLHIVIQFEHFNVAGLIIIASGIVICLVAIFGILGAARESSQMTKTVSIRLAH